MWTLLIRVSVDLHQSNLAEVVDSGLLPSSLAKVVASKALSLGSSSRTTPQFKSICQEIIASLRERNPEAVDSAALETPDIDTSLVARPDGETAMLNILSADISARVQGLEALLSPYLLSSLDDVSDEDKQSLSSALISRLADTDIPVLDSLYKSTRHKDIIARVSTVDDILGAIERSFVVDKISEDVILRHLEFAVNELVNARPEAADSVFEKILFPILLPLQGRALSAKGWSLINTSALKTHHPLTKALADANVASPLDIASQIAREYCLAPRTQG